MDPQNSNLQNSNLSQPEISQADIPKEEPKTEKPRATKYKKPKKAKKPYTTKQKIGIAIAVVIIIALLGVLGYIIFIVSQDPEQAKNQRVEFPDPIYSILTGEEIADASFNQKPTFCVQIPNGADGARPQAGLNQADIIFEAIAERGITRFAAVFQDPMVSAIGPIRSLRPYYLDWDTPFDCTVVHAGGSHEALAAINAGGQRNLDESEYFMWREYYSDRGWNNLFTSSELLKNFNAEYGYHTSNITAFKRMTPDEAEAIAAENSQCPEDTPECTVEYVSPAINFGAATMYNTFYTYDPETNHYLRSYATGEPHLTYSCPPNLEQPNTATDCGDPIQVSPSVIIAMIVNEGTMSDGYHENITTIGSGTALIFQNGSVVEATWVKNSQKDQIVFLDSNGDPVALTPGQLWIAAVPQYGSVEY